jgi:hypothetical protein
MQDAIELVLSKQNDQGYGIMSIPLWTNAGDHR